MGHGEMDAPRLNWLKARLDEQPDRPSMIFMHHPPSRPGCSTWTRSTAATRRRWPRYLRGRTNIERVACRPPSPLDPDPLGRHDRSVAPSVAHQVVLDLKPPTTHFTMEPPGYHMHSGSPRPA